MTIQMNNMLLEPSDRFISFPIKDGVLFKKITLPDLKEEFEQLAKDIQKQFKTSNISKKEVKDAMRWVRKK